jgi:hypothetical protein
MAIQRRKTVLLMGLSSRLLTIVIINAGFSLNYCRCKLKCFDTFLVFLRSLSVRNGHSERFYSSTFKLMPFLLLRSPMDHFTVTKQWKMCFLMLKNGFKWDKRLVKVSVSTSIFLRNFRS